MTSTVTGFTCAFPWIGTQPHLTGLDTDVGILTAVTGFLSISLIAASVLSSPGHSPRIFCIVAVVQATSLLAQLLLVRNILGWNHMVSSSVEAVPGWAAVVAIVGSAVATLSASVLAVPFLSTDEANT